MSNWKFAQEERSTDLAMIHHFSIMRKDASGEVEFRITVKEFAKPSSHSLSFFAQADKQINQNTLPVTPAGWGDSLLTALAECIREIHRFPYEGPR